MMVDAMHLGLLQSQRRHADPRRLPHNGVVTFAAGEILDPRMVQVADAEASSKLASLKVGSEADEGAVEALRELVAGPSYTPKKATTRLKQLEWDGGIAERAKILYMVPAPAPSPPVPVLGSNRESDLGWDGAQAF